MSEELQQKIDTVLKVVKTMQHSMATKDELQSVKDSMATKDELQSVKDSMATKDELQSVKAQTDKILNELLSVKEKVDQCVTKDEFEQKTDEVLTIMDNFAKQITDVKDEQAVNVAAHDRFEERISHVEGVLQAKPAG